MAILGVVHAHACAVARVTAIIAMTALSTGAFAQDAGGAAAVTRNPITIYTQNRAAFAAGGPAAQLLQTAREKGSIRVIVGLRIVTRMEHTLTAAQVTQQRGAQRQVENAVAARVLGSAAAAGVVRFEFIPYMSMRVNAAQLGRLLADPQAVSIQEDVPRPPLLNESIPLIHADDVFAKGADGNGYVVAVLDTGFAKTHPMLAGKVVSEACYSLNDPPNKNASLCPGGVDSSTAAGSAVNCPVGATGLQGCEHGTHVASIAAGNSSKYDGVARDAKIIAVQVFSKDTTTNKIGSLVTDEILGLKRVLALHNIGGFKIAAVNMSLGAGKFSGACDIANAAEKTAIDNLRAVGIPTVIASGNDGYNFEISAPACISSAIAVGNATKDDRLAASSNNSALVKLLAPGTMIKAAVPPGSSCITNNGPHCALTGTSMAAPHVAGAFAVLKDAKPAATLAQILEALTCSGRTIDLRRLDTGRIVEATYAKPRIDLLGAHNFLTKPTSTVRSWAFDSAVEAQDWAPFRGAWSIAGGNYRHTPVKRGWVGSIVANCNANTQVTVRMRRVNPGAPSGATSWNSGIVLRSTLEYHSEHVSGYFMAFNNAPDPITKVPGSAALWRFNRFNFELGVGDAVDICGKFMPIDLTGYNTIKVVSRGQKHIYYLNNTEVCTIFDTVYTSGPLMVAAYMSNVTTGQALYVDTVQIKSLPAASSPDGDDTGDPVMDPASLAPRPARHGQTPAGNRIDGGPWSKPRLTGPAPATLGPPRIP